MDILVFTSRYEYPSLVNYPGYPALRALEAYDPATNSWEEIPMIPMPRHGLAGAVVGDGLYLISGNIQSVGINEMRVATDSHDAYEFTDR